MLVAACVLLSVKAEPPVATTAETAAAPSSIVNRDVVDRSLFVSPADYEGHVALRPRLAPNLPLSWTVVVSTVAGVSVDVL